MPVKFVEPVFYEPLSKLDFSNDFCIVCELAGYHTLGDVLQRQTCELLKLPGFNYHMLTELVSFLEKRHMGHYVDPD